MLKTRQINFSLGRVLIREIFYFSFLAWLLLSLMELCIPKIVLVYFNLNYLLLATIIFGLATLTQAEPEKNKF